MRAQILHPHNPSVFNLLLTRCDLRERPEILLLSTCEILYVKWRMALKPAFFAWMVMIQHAQQCRLLKTISMHTTEPASYGVMQALLLGKCYVLRWSCSRDETTHLSFIEQPRHENDMVGSLPQACMNAKEPIITRKHTTCIWPFEDGKRMHVHDRCLPDNSTTICIFNSSFHCITCV